MVLTQSTSYHAQLVFILTKLPPDVSLRISCALAYVRILNGILGRLALKFPTTPLSMRPDLP